MRIDPAGYSSRVSQAFGIAHAIAQAIDVASGIAVCFKLSKG